MRTARAEERCVFGGQGGRDGPHFRRTRADQARGSGRPLRNRAARVIRTVRSVHTGESSNPIKSTSPGETRMALASEPGREENPLSWKRKMTSCEAKWEMSP